MPIASRERDAARLVAHVRAVGEVVRAEHPADELVEERRLVATCAPTCRTRVRVGPGGAQLVGDQRERVVPRDRPVVAAVEHHRMGEPAELAELEVGQRAQLVDRQPREQLGRRARGRRLLGERLRAVLAELERGARSAAGSGHAQPGQSKPSGWFIAANARAPRTRPESRCRCFAVISSAEPAGGARQIRQLELGELGFGVRIVVGHDRSVHQRYGAPWPCQVATGSSGARTHTWTSASRHTKIFCECGSTAKSCHGR